MPDENITDPDQEEAIASEVPKIGITGLPNSGKTQLLLKIIEMLETEGKVVGGMITEVIIFRNRKVGFYVVDWMTKKKRKFAHANIESTVHVEEYGVDMRALDAVGVKAIRNAIKSADVIIIDEVGKMEVESPGFVAAVNEAMDSDKPLIMTLHKKSRNPLLQDIRRRDDLRILEVTPVNRNLLPYKIMGLMRGEVL
ncbi:MAG: NTPase [Candidatus Thermoplasmatota archaeon]|nr:NTPase [Euryarchaeota archaeon]MBU4032620.1 NTPase [Candidatus Thermoplasmatota archaeon]MBU4071406.1 NTPase [Candidatus Thermoplasmatota archaeon]MBU4144898.1 NTPase [Candidatus Thermoplasmatota archaeon]MBU4592391.1 NTPase [Candidatus Thermoplasmatota archaeon]